MVRPCDASIGQRNWWAGADRQTARTVDGGREKCALAPSCVAWKWNYSLSARRAIKSMRS